MKFTQKAIDGHWHLYTWYDKNGVDFYTTIDKYLVDHNLAGINICSIPCHRDSGPMQNVLAALYKLHNPNAYAYGAFVYTDKPAVFPQPEGFDMLTQYEDLKAIGFDGIKMLETKPAEQKEYQVRVDDEAYEEFFSACERDETHMVWHVADPDTFWDIERIPPEFIDYGWYYGDGTYLSYEEMHETAYKVLERHPKLKVTFAHFFFLSGHPEKLAELFGKYENMGIDITPGTEMYADFRVKREFYREFFTKYADRIFFGTDLSVDQRGNTPFFNGLLDAVYSFVSTDEEVHVGGETAHGLGLPKDVQEKILLKNFQRVAGEQPKPVQTEALKRYVEKYRPYFKDKEALALVDAALKEM